MVSNNKGPNTSPAPVPTTPKTALILFVEIKASNKTRNKSVTVPVTVKRLRSVMEPARMAPSKRARTKDAPVTTLETRTMLEIPALMSCTSVAVTRSVVAMVQLKTNDVKSESRDGRITASASLSIWVTGCPFVVVSRNACAEGGKANSLCSSAHSRLTLADRWPRGFGSETRRVLVRSRCYRSEDDCVSGMRPLSSLSEKEEADRRLGRLVWKALKSAEAGCTLHPIRSMEKG